MKGAIAHKHLVAATFPINVCCGNVASWPGFPSMRLEDFSIDVAKLTRRELSVLSNVSVSTIQREEEGQSMSRLMIARILDGLSKHLGVQR